MLGRLIDVFRHVGSCRVEMWGGGWLCRVVILTCLMPPPGFAQESMTPIREENGGVVQGPEFPGQARDEVMQPPKGAASSAVPEASSFAISWEMRPNRSYVIPALEIPAYLFLLNQYDRHFTDPRELYRTTGNTIRTHLTDSKWVIDDDQFSVNQFLHPYSGTVYF